MAMTADDVAKVTRWTVREVESAIVRINRAAGITDPEKGCTPDELLAFIIDADASVLCPITAIDLASKAVEIVSNHKDGN